MVVKPELVTSSVEKSRVTKARKLLPPIPLSIFRCTARRGSPWAAGSPESSGKAWWSSNGVTHTSIQSRRAVRVVDMSKRTTVSPPAAAEKSAIAGGLR
jgi:hypothetical protein